MDLIAGLGNPGSDYDNTRHNVGFRTIQQLSQKLGVRLTDRRFQSRNIRTKTCGKEVVLFCPATFMNLSGKAVKQFADFYGVNPESMLIVHDDLDLPVGRIKVVIHGGSGGHRGVQSVIDYLGSTQFPRVKIGIGRPRHGEETEDFVLSPFYIDEIDIMDKVIQLSVLACQLFVSEGVESVMNAINRKK